MIVGSAALSASARFAPDPSLHNLTVGVRRLGMSML